MSPPAEYPFQSSDIDLHCQRGKMFVAYACRLTGFVEIASFNGFVTPSALIPVLWKWFVCWGAPEEISTGVGTNLTSAEMLVFNQR